MAFRGSAIWRHRRRSEAQNGDYAAILQPTKDCVTTGTCRTAADTVGASATEPVLAKRIYSCRRFKMRLSL